MNYILSQNFCFFILYVTITLHECRRAYFSIACKSDKELPYRCLYYYYYYYKLYYRLAVYIRRHIWQLSKTQYNKNTTIENTTLQIRLLHNATRHDHIAAPSSGNIFLKSVQCWRRVTLSQWYY